MITISSPLSCIRRVQEIVSSPSSTEDVLRRLCKAITTGLSLAAPSSVRISFNGTATQSIDFAESPNALKEELSFPDNKHLTFEVFRDTPFSDDDDQLLKSIVKIVSDSYSTSIYGKLHFRTSERLKELGAVNRVSDTLSRGLSLGETLTRVAATIPFSMLHPDIACARISYTTSIFESKDFEESPWNIKSDFTTIDGNHGDIMVCYRQEVPRQPDGSVFLKEEQQLLSVITRLVCGYMDNYLGRDVYVNRSRAKNTTVSEDFRKALTTDKKPLQLFFNKQILEKYVYLDMMKYKIHNILFVATLFDAFTLENDDSFFEQFMGEIYQYSLFSLPRITGVASADDALELIKTTRFDMALLMIGLDADASFALSAEIKEQQPDIPVYLLASEKSGVREVEKRANQTPSVDKVFVWGGNSDVIFSIVKSTEDEVNVATDTRIGLVRVILLVEDSPEYYSKYLRILFSTVFNQVQKLLEEDDHNEINRVSKMRQRPKILHARNYEDAMYFIEKYRDYLLCVISDVEFERAGASDPMAGVTLLKMLQSELPELPTILQSAVPDNKKLADQLGVTFLYKESETLSADLVSFLTSRLGFGDFIFANKHGRPVAQAKGVKEFKTIFKNIPTDQLKQYCRDFRISSWLMSRGEIPLARTLNAVSFFDFDDPEEFRGEVLHLMDEYQSERRRGKKLDYDEVEIPDERNIIMMSSGKLGGKGRGLAFINTLIQNMDTSEFDGFLNLRIPITAIVGTDEFSAFMKRGNLMPYAMSDPDYAQLRERFNDTPLSDKLMSRLRRFVSQVHRPMAVRSSSLSEDSMNQPFAGVFDTYLVPNNSPDIEENVRNIASAIKMVYASIYSPSSRAYFQSTKINIEKEKMAVVLQVLVGSEHDGFYYPHVAGTAQSYNYYPVAHMQPEEGFAVAGFGLGYYVVGGSKAYRFSPAWPTVDIMSTADIVKNTQVDFLAVDLNKKGPLDYVHDGETAPLATLDISDAEHHGTLKHCASVYNPQNDTIEPGLYAYGPRVVNFADILKHDYIPLSRLLSVVLAAAKDAFGTPVEIEWAVDLTEDERGVPSFYLLQMKPIITDLRGDTVKVDEPNKDEAVLYTTQSLGNGNVKNITDIIFCDPDTFDKMQTEQMKKEVAYLNDLMIKDERNYILIGPGRWGTRDKFIGIPVAWSEISKAKLIVEMSLPGFPLDSSLGSHFFHNVTSMNIGYLSVQSESPIDYVNWDVIRALPEVRRTTFFRQVRAPKPFDIRMNGKERRAVVRVKR